MLCSPVRSCGSPDVVQARAQDAAQSPLFAGRTPHWTQPLPALHQQTAHGQFKDLDLNFLEEISDAFSLAANH